ncbi:MAG: hypothetical protein MHMPM18_001362 [Marteilia pararefringens]
MIIDDHNSGGGAATLQQDRPATMEPNSDAGETNANELITLAEGLSISYLMTLEENRKLAEGAANLRIKNRELLERNNKLEKQLNSQILPSKNCELASNESGESKILREELKVQKLLNQDMTDKMQEFISRIKILEERCPESLSKASSQSGLRESADNIMKASIDNCIEKLQAKAKYLEQRVLESENLLNRLREALNQCEDQNNRLRALIYACDTEKSVIDSVGWEQIVKLGKFAAYSEDYDDDVKCQMYREEGRKCKDHTASLEKNVKTLNAIIDDLKKEVGVLQSQVKTQDENLTKKDKIISEFIDKGNRESSISLDN